MEAPRYVGCGVHSLGACPAVVTAVAESPRMQWELDGMAEVLPLRLEAHGGGVSGEYSEV